MAEHTDSEGFDIVYDTVGGTTLDNSFLAVCRTPGALSAAWVGALISWRRCHFAELDYSGVFTLLPMLTGKGRIHHGDILREATKLAEAGKLTPLLCRERFTFENALQAHVAVEMGKTVGRVVVEIDD